MRSIDVDNLDVTLEFDLRASVGAGSLFGLAMTSHDTGYVSTRKGGDVIEFNVTSSTSRQVLASQLSSDVIFSLAYSIDRPRMYPVHGVAVHFTLSMIFCLAKREKIMKMYTSLTDPQ